MPASIPKNFTFEQALAELEEITQRLESGKDSLDTSMSLYEKGILLKEFCQKQLKEAEGKWVVLKKEKNGKVSPQEISSKKIPEPNELNDLQEKMF